MIKALETGPAGVCMVFGLTWANLDKLADNKPIRVRSDQLGVRPGFDVWIIGGADRTVLGEDLRAVGMTVPDGDDVWDGGLLRFFTRWRGLVRAGGPEMNVAVLGITDPADTALRDGGGFQWAIPGRAGVAVRLCAGPDSDTVGRQITAGRPIGQLIDQRDGRTD